MRKSRLPQRLFGLILIVCLPVRPALAQLLSAWVSVAVGDDINNCTIGSPCRSLGRAITQTISGGTISVRDPGDYGGVLINHSVTIVNDSAGTVTACCSFFSGNIVVAAGANDVVTLRGLTFIDVGSAQAPGVQIFNAGQVNIDNCAFLGTAGAGILVTPGTGGQIVTLASRIDVSVQDTLINGDVGGIMVTSIPGVTVIATVDRTRINNNFGAGIRADGSGGGAVRVVVSDSTITLNAGNGVLALSGPGAVGVHVTRSVIASNLSSGVQSNQTNGSTAIATVRGSTLIDNANGAVNFFGGGTLLTFGDNNIVGPNGTGFSGPIALQ